MKDNNKATFISFKKNSQIKGKKLKERWLKVVLRRIETYCLSK